MRIASGSEISKGRLILEAFDGAGINLKEEIISGEKIPQIRFAVSESLQDLRNGASHRSHQPRFPPQELPEGRDFELLESPPNRSPSDSEPPPGSPATEPPSPRSSERLLEFLAVSQPPVPEFACGRGFELRHGGFRERN